jgi:hypothetical protein
MSCSLARGQPAGAGGGRREGGALNLDRRLRSARDHSHPVLGTNVQLVADVTVLPAMHWRYCL